MMGIAAAGGNPHHPILLSLRNIDFWEEAACDHEALDLRGSFKDVKDFGIAEPLLDELPVL